MKRLLLALVVVAWLVGCHVTPLPVPYPEDWTNGGPEYPPLNVGASRDAGRDGGSR